MGIASRRAATRCAVPVGQRCRLARTMGGVVPRTGTRALMVTGQWLEGVRPYYQLVLSEPARIKMQLKVPDQPSMSLRLAVAKEKTDSKKVLQLKNTELLKILPSKVEPGKEGTTFYLSMAASS